MLRGTNASSFEIPSSEELDHDAVPCVPWAHHAAASKCAHLEAEGITHSHKEGEIVPWEPHGYMYGLGRSLIQDT